MNARCCLPQGDGAAADRLYAVNGESEARRAEASAKWGEFLMKSSCRRTAERRASSAAADVSTRGMRARDGGREGRRPGRRQEEAAAATPDATVRRSAAAKEGERR